VEVGVARKLVTGTIGTSAIGSVGDGALDVVAAGDGLGPPAASGDRIEVDGCATVPDGGVGTADGAGRAPSSPSGPTASRATTTKPAAASRIHRDTAGLWQKDRRRGFPAAAALNR
jgi:hypothetical protein